MAKEGRPLAFETVEELDKAIQTYFDSCFNTYWEDEKVRDSAGNFKYIKAEIGNGVEQEIRHVRVKKIIKYPAVSALAYALGIDRRTLLNYENKDEFFPTIEKAKRFIESMVEEGFLNGGINSSAGQFTLKNNWNWKDEIHNTVTDTKLTPEEQAKIEMILGKKIDNNDKQNRKSRHVN